MKYDLNQINSRAMELYLAGVSPPDAFRNAMRDSGVPEKEMWGVREAMEKAKKVAPPKTRKKKVRKWRQIRNFQPPPVSWDDIQDRKTASAGKD